MLFHNRQTPVDPGVPSRSDLGAWGWWNLWRTKQYPFDALVEGTRVVLVDSWRKGGQTMGRLTWEVEVAGCAKGQCKNKSEALGRIAKAMGLSRDQVLSDPYTAAKPSDAGWFLAWSVRPLRRIHLPRPTDLQFWPQGWLRVDDSRQLRRWGLDDSRGPIRRVQVPSRGVRGRLSKEERVAVEQRALLVARQWCQGQNWDNIKEHPRGPYDFSARVSGASKYVYVEVKGKKGTQLEAEVTAGEVRHARQHAAHTYLVLVAGIRIRKGRRGPVGEGGSLHVFERWNPPDKDLQALTYVWRAPAP